MLRLSIESSLSASSPAGFDRRRFNAAAAAPFTSSVSRASWGVKNRNMNIPKAKNRSFRRL